MPEISFKTLPLTRRHPFQTARGVSVNGQSLMLSIESEGLQGIGESAPHSLAGADSVDVCRAQIEAFTACHDITASPREEVRLMAIKAGLAACSIAAIDTALWDIEAKRAGSPLYRYLDLLPVHAESSVTIGLMEPAGIGERVMETIARTGARCLKIKLGSPRGIKTDMAIMESTLRAIAGSAVGLRVDANGGWSVRDAKAMLPWLAEHDVRLVEQPLARGQEVDLRTLRGEAPIPIYVDESCLSIADINNVADHIDGVNLKLMKHGGITGSLKMIALARERGLKVMLGCMCESSIGISAAASIASLADEIDLDSNVNLLSDPASGVRLSHGHITTSPAHGHGAALP
ncbi:MAG: enolase C-terminal domain-like protein [Pseudomonadota bacterium]